MIFTDRTIMVKNGTSSINDTIVLYRGDRDVEIRFTISEGSPFKFGSGSSPNIIEKADATYGQLVIKTPGALPPIFSEVTPTIGGKIIFTITAEMIDEITEVGNYTFQIRLLDESRNSRATIPEVVNGIEIREPIATEDNTNEVGVATVGYALTTAAANEDAFDAQGNYNKTTWATGDRITAAKLNKIEAGIDGVNQKVASGGTGSNNASDISITDTGIYFTSTNVEGALQEAGSQIKEIMNSGNISSIEPAEDDLPKVFFYGDISNMSKTISVDLDFEYKSRTANYKGVANTKWQGSSSLSYDKKNYTIKLFTDNTKSSKLKLNLKGWGEQNKFCLKANYVDSLHVRNLAGARIAYDMIKSRSDFSSLPTELQQAPRCGVIDGFPIKVYINGELMGLYTWNIPKDKWCSNMDENNTNHAFLMAEKNNNGSSTDSLVLACEFRANATIFADTSTAQYPAYDWVVEGPGDDVSDDIRTSFNNLINCVKDTDDDTFKSTIGNYLDLTSAFDYYCFAYLMCHYDGLGKNLGMATYDGVKWFCTLYDMDSIFGAKIDGSGFLETNRQCPEQYQETNSLLWQRIEKCFGEELYSRYLELRQGALSLGNIFTHVEEIYDVISDRVYKEDKSKWTSLPSASTNTIERIRTYMISRASYVDAEMLEIGTPVVEIPCTRIVTLNKGYGFNAENGQYTTSADKNYSASEEYIPLTIGKKYVISGETGFMWLTIIGYNSDKTFRRTISTGVTNANQSYTYTADCEYIRVGALYSNTITITHVPDDEPVT